MPLRFDEIEEVRKIAREIALDIVKAASIKVVEKKEPVKKVTSKEPEKATVVVDAKVVTKKEGKK